MVEQIISHSSFPCYQRFQLTLQLVQCTKTLKFRQNNNDAENFPWSLQNDEQHSIPVKRSTALVALLDGFRSVTTV